MTMPPEAEKLAAQLQAAAKAASQLEAAEPDLDRASLLAGLRDVVDCAARVLVACYGADQGCTVQQAHLLRAAAGGVLNDAETLAARDEAAEPVLHLERTEGQSMTGWARWRVLDAGGVLVGFVFEHHEWLGHAYGPATYEAVCNPTGEDYRALWRGEAHDSPQEALAALAAQLRARGTPGSEDRPPGQP